MLVVELFTGSSGRYVSGGITIPLAVVFVGILIVGLVRAIVRPTVPRIKINKTLIDGKEVTVLDGAQLSSVVASLKTPGFGVAKLLDANSPVWTQLNDALQGAGTIDANSPFRVIVQVRSALQTGQLESVRHLISDQLYQRLSAAPPVPVASPQRLFMVTNRHSGDDPNRVVVRIGGSLVVPGAQAEDWTMVRAGADGTVPTPMPVPDATAPAEPAQSSTCPYCSATLDPGAKRCRFCGMDVTLAPPTSLTLSAPATDLSVTPTAAPTESGWIVDDVTAVSSMAA